MNNYQILVHIATLYVLYEVCTYKFCNRTLQCLKFERSIQFWLKFAILFESTRLLVLPIYFPSNKVSPLELFRFNSRQFSFLLYCLSSSTWSSKFPPIFLANCAPPLSRPCDPTTFPRNPLRLFCKSPRLPTLRLPT